MGVVGVVGYGEEFLLVSTPRPPDHTHNIVCLFPRMGSRHVCPQNRLFLTLRESPSIFKEAGSMDRLHHRLSLFSVSRQRSRITECEGEPPNRLSLTLRESSCKCILLIHFNSLQQRTFFNFFLSDCFRITQNEGEPPNPR